MSRASRRKPAIDDAGPPLSPLPPSPQPLQGIWRMALPVMLACYLALAITHAMLVPTGETGYQNAPDEAAHVTYIRSMGSGHLPTRADPQPGQSAPRPSYEWHQPPLYYAWASLFLPLGERGLRTASILCGLAGILLIYRAARTLFPEDPKIAVVAAGVAALTPGHIAITSTVNNDPLLEVCFSAVLLLLIASLKGSWTTKRAFWLGAALGAALLTKATAVLLIPVIAFALVLLWRGGEPPKRLFSGLTWTLGAACSISGWWLVRNYLLYHEVLPLQAFQQSFGGTAQAADIVSGRLILPGPPIEGWGGYLLRVGQMTFQSFWAVYGTKKTAGSGWPLFLPDQLYWLMGAITLTVLGGMIRLHFRSKTDLTPSQRFSLWVQFLTLLLVAGSFLTFVLRYFQTQGRYLYPAMLPLCLIIALGWRSALPPRYAALGSGLLLALFAVLALAFLNYVVPQ